LRARLEERRRLMADNPAPTSDPVDDDDDDDLDDGAPPPADVAAGDPVDVVAEPPPELPVPAPPPEPPQGWQIRQRVVVRWNPDTGLVALELPRISAYSADITGPVAAGYRAATAEFETAFQEVIHAVNETEMAKQIAGWKATSEEVEMTMADKSAVVTVMQNEIRQLHLDKGNPVPYREKLKAVREELAWLEEWKHDLDGAIREAESELEKQKSEQLEERRREVFAEANAERRRLEQKLLAALDPEILGRLAALSPNAIELSRDRILRNGQT